MTTLALDFSLPVNLNPPQQEAQPSPNELGLLQASQQPEFFENNNVGGVQAQRGLGEFGWDLQPNIVDEAAGADVTSLAHLYGSGVADGQNLSESLEDSAVKPRLTVVSPLQPGLSDRVLSRLAKMEAKEVNPHLADDYRISWLTILACAEGEFTADMPGKRWGEAIWEYSFWKYLGISHAKFMIEFAARQKRDAAMAGDATLPSSTPGLPPKKEPESEIEFIRRRA